MGILALSADERVRDVRISEDTLTVDLMDGRTISVPCCGTRGCSPARPSSARSGSRARQGTAFTGQTWTRTSAQKVSCAARLHRRFPQNA